MVLKSSVFTTHALIIRSAYESRRSRTSHKPIDDHPSTESQQTPITNHCESFFGPQKSNCFPDAHGESSTIAPCPPYIPSLPSFRPPPSSHMSRFRPARPPTESRFRDLQEVLHGREGGTSTHTHPQTRSQTFESRARLHAFIIYKNAGFSRVKQHETSNLPIDSCISVTRQGKLEVAIITSSKTLYTVIAETKAVTS